MPSSSDSESASDHVASTATTGGPVTVIWNQGAGRKAGLPTNVDMAEGELAKLFADAGLDVVIAATGSEDEATERTRAAIADGSRAIVAAGGDGTVRVVARVLIDAASGGGAAPPLGILPLGSVMNVVRSLSIPRELPEAAGVIARGHTRAIDAMAVPGGDTFLEGVAIGLHAELFGEGVALDEGDAKAPLRAIWKTLRYQPSRITIRLDDGRVERARALMLSVSNGPYSGLGFTIAPGARLDDGLLDVRVFERFSRVELARHFLAIMSGRRAYEPRVRTYRGARITVESASPLHVRADGEALGDTPVTLHVRPRALRVLVPETPDAGEISLGRSP